MKAQQNWASLSQEDQWQVARRAAQNYEKRLKDHPNFVSIGYGYLEQSETLTSLICVKVSVRRKWKSRSTRKGKIPAYILTSWTDKFGTSRQYAVPTDVSALGAIRPMSAMGAATQTRRQIGSGNYRRDFATGCCLVKFQGYANLYHLGCAHALAQTRRFRRPKAHLVAQYQTAVRHQNSGGQWRFVGSLQAIAPMSKVDAAVVRVTNQAGMTPGLPNGLRLQGVYSSSIFPRRFNLYGRNGRVLCEHIENTVRLSVPYHIKEGRRIYRYRDVPKYRAVGGAVLSVGDSGSPIVTQDGYLAGMHFAGNRHYGFCFQIPRILEAFTPPLRIVI